MGRTLHRASASSSASIIPLNLGVGCAPSCWPIFGFRNLLGARRGAQRAVFCAVRLADFLAEGAGQGTRRVVGGVGGKCAGAAVAKIICGIVGRCSFTAAVPVSIIPRNRELGCAPSCWPILGFRNLLGARRGHRGQFFVQSENRFSGRGGGVGSLPRAWRRVGVPGAAGAKKNV